MPNEYTVQSAANMELVYEYRSIIKCLRKLIKMTEAKYLEMWTYSDKDIRTNTKHLFVKSILCYLCEAFYCMKDGRFYATNMILRTVVENYFLLSAMEAYTKMNLSELWNLNSILMATEKERIDEVALSYGLDPDQINWPALKKQYGWLYPILPKKANIRNLCECLGEEYERLYDIDYRVLCEYVHGGSMLQKEGTFTFDTSLISMVIRIGEYLMRTVSMWCEENVEFEQEMDRLWDMLSEGT